MKLNEVRRLTKGQVHPNVVKVLEELSIAQAMQKQYLGEITQVVLATLGGLKELSQAMDTMHARQMDELRERVHKLSQSHERDDEDVQH